MIKKIRVLLNFGSEKHEVGDLVELNGHYYFTYARDFPSQTLRISPFKLPIDTGFAHKVEERDRRVFDGVHGVFADSMPDGWGLLLIKRTVENKGIPFSSLSPLDILSFVGNRGLGALEYKPVYETESLATREIDLAQLSRESEKIFEGEASSILPLLLGLGGSPGGARPKVLVAVGPGTEGQRVIRPDSDTLPEGFTHWMIKFRGKLDHQDDAVTEFKYMQAAEQAGLKVPSHELFESNGKQYFGVKRFDRSPNGEKMHLHSLAGMVHADFRMPSMDYRELLKVTRRLTQSHDEVLRAFRLAVFNVLFHNRDDHGKNFSFLMDKQGNWSLSPAYDLTYAQGPGNEHATSILGSGKDVGSDKLLDLAKLGGIEKKEAGLIIKEVRAAKLDMIADFKGMGLGKHPLVLATTSRFH